jgi:hypothetical protein
MFTFQYLVGKPKQQRKIVIFLQQKSLCFFLSLALQTFILLYFMKEKRQKDPKAQKTKVMIHGGGE